MNGDGFELDNGRYRAGRMVGHGNFGDVYQGTDTHQDAIVAIKLFRDTVDFDAVMTEAQVQTRLSEHPRVASIRNVILEPPRPFVVMDYYGAGSVRDRLDAGEVSLVSAIRWTRDALSGLGHAHALGVIHRDMKPGNWLLSQGERVAISDFGIAEDTIRQLAVDDRLYVAHMAPELVNAPSSPQSDVWAVGCTLYRLLTGGYPFADIDETLRGDFEAPHRINPQVPLSLTRVVQRSLALPPEDRYANAADMLAALNACRVMASWEQVDEPEALESWQTQTPTADFRIRLVHRARVGFELVAMKDLRGGAGFRQVRGERFSSAARARQGLRAWLVTVVEGRGL